MKKSHSKSGTLTRLFGKKQNSDNLFAPNPPWILPHGKGQAEPYGDGGLPAFSYGDECGTATLKARPRVRPIVPFTGNNAHEVYGLAVPTPSIPFAFADNASLGYGQKVNGNYRMYSSVGDLRSMNYSDIQVDDYIPPPPSMPPPPPPPSMAPPPPAMQKKPPSPLINSPASPSPPDFIPPTPVAPPSVSPPVLPSLTQQEPPPHPPMSPPAPPTMAPPPPPPPPPSMAPPAPPTMAPPAPPAVAPPAPPPMAPTPSSTSNNELHQKFTRVPPPPLNVSKWKSETGLNTVNQISSHTEISSPSLHKSKLSPNTHGTLPKSFKIPPPAPARTSSILPHIRTEQASDEYDSESNKALARSPIPSSFNPKAEAKLFLPNQTAFIEAMNKRRSMIMMDEPPSPPTPPSPTPNISPKTMTKNLPLTPPEIENNMDFRINSIPTDMRNPIPVEIDNTHKKEFSDTNTNKLPTGENNSNQINGVDKLKNDVPSIWSRKGEQLIPWYTVDNSAEPGKVSKDDSKPSSLIGKALPPLPVVGGHRSITQDLKQHPCRNTAPEITPLSPPDQFNDLNQKDGSKFNNNFSNQLSALKDEQQLEGSINSRPDNDQNKVKENIGSSLTNQGEPKIKSLLKIAPLALSSRDTGKNDWVSWNAGSVSNKMEYADLPSPDYSPSGSNPASPKPVVKPKSFISSSVSLPTSMAASTATVLPQESVESSSSQYKPHHSRQVSVSSMSSINSFTPVHDEPESPTKSWDSISASSDNSPSHSSETHETEQKSSELTHPVTGEQVEAGSPMALLLAARERAQKSKLARTREHRKLSESSSSGKSSATIFCISNSNPNSFVVKPKSSSGLSEDNNVPKPITVTSPSERLLNRLNWRHEESSHEKADTPRPDQNCEQRNNETSSHVSHMQSNNSSAVQISSFTSPTPFTVMGNENWRDREHQKSDTSQGKSFPHPVLGQQVNRAANLQVSSFATPTPYSVVDDDRDLNVEVIPPPPEFSNDHEPTSYMGSEVNERDAYSKGHLPVRIKTFTIRTDSNGAGYDRNYAPQAPQINSKYTNSYANTSPIKASGDLQNRSLIKRRLYIPEPENQPGYGRAPSSSRFQLSSAPYSSNAGQYSSTLAASRSTMQRRMSMENQGRSTLPNSVMREVSQIAQNRDYSYSQTANRVPYGSSSYHSTTFTVRPGTRQPISYTQEGVQR